MRSCIDRESRGSFLAMEEISSSPQPGQAEPAAAPVPAEVKMSAGEIVKLLPSLSPGLYQALLRFLQGRCSDEGIVDLSVSGSQAEAVREQVCEGFAAELEALAAVEGGSSGDVILQLSLCLLLALAPSLPNACDIEIGDYHGFFGKRTYGGEQAMEVLCSALVSQHWSNAVRQLTIRNDEAFGTDGACEHLAHLLQSSHCKLQQLQMYETGTGAGGMRHIARALGTNSSLTVLRIAVCREVGDGGVEQLAAMLRTNSTLEELTLNGIGMTAHGLGHLCDALSTQQSLPATSSPSGRGIMPMHMGGVKKLDICHNSVGVGGAAHLGAMLAQNRCLRTVQASYCSLVEEDGEGHLAKGMRENSTLEELNISYNKLGKVALGLLVRCLATNNNTRLKTLNISNDGEMPAAEELAHMIAYNQSLVELQLRCASYDAGEWATVILPALGRNRTLLSIDLSCCPGVQGDQVRAALVDLLCINTTIQKIGLEGTRLEYRGEAEAVEVELRRNNVFRHALSCMPGAKPKACRIVLCGHAYAGKTSLLQSMKLLQQDMQHMSLSQSEHLLFVQSSHHNKSNLKDKELSTRTRGIEIHMLKDEEDLRISVWDLAGRREFHVLHNFMFSRRNNAALFVFVFSPIVSPVDELRAGELKTMCELEEELLYWLRLITSNSNPIGGAPTVVVVITHKDTLLTLTSSTYVESWVRHAQENIIVRLAAKFGDRVKVQPRPFIVNALASQDVELNRWVKEVEESLRSTLDGLEEEPAICTQVLRAIQHDALQTRSNSPIISRTKFLDICRSLTPDIAEIAQAKEKEDMEMEDESEDESEDELEGLEDIGMEHEVKEEGQADRSHTPDMTVELESEEGRSDRSHTSDMTVELESEEGRSDSEAKFLAAIGDKIGTAIGAYLHDAGDIIHHEKLNFIIPNPKWLYHEVLGQLIDLVPSFEMLVRPKNGWVSRGNLSNLFQEAVKSVPGLDPTVVTLDQFIQLMLLLDVEYETRLWKGPNPECSRGQGTTGCLA